MTITSSQTGGFTAAIFLLLRRSRFVQCVAGFVGIRTLREITELTKVPRGLDVARSLSRPSICKDIAVHAIPASTNPSSANRRFRAFLVPFGVTSACHPLSAGSDLDKINGRPGKVK